MEACYAEGSKSRGDAVPQISLRPLAHQNCIRRDRIVAVAPTNGDSGQSFGLVSSFKLSQQPLRFLLRQSASNHLLGYSPLTIKLKDDLWRLFSQSPQALSLGSDRWSVAMTITFAIIKPSPTTISISSKIVRGSVTNLWADLVYDRGRLIKKSSAA
jgi:hypothetical protein